MEQVYGYSKMQWMEAKRVAYEAMRAKAARRETMTYTELAAALRVSAIYIEPRDPALGALLGQISEQEDGEGNGMLSAIVVHKNGDMKPGRGFLNCAEGLGKDISDPDKLWISELNTVWDCWAK